jgi:hypothetical protein
LQGLALFAVVIDVRQWARPLHLCGCLCIFQWVWRRRSAPQSNEIATLNMHPFNTASAVFSGCKTHTGHRELR